MKIPFHGSQYPGKGGHYESWFLRANDPKSQRAFWIRYTQFIAADNRPALGEIWAMWFDGDADRVIAVKQEFPLEDCRFSKERMDVELPVAELASHALKGRADHNGNSISWNLSYEGEPDSLLLLPENFYNKPLPKAKTVTSRPQVRYKGTLEVNGETFQLDGWPGSENHNWGSKHTDQYAWGQVVRFDNHRDAFFECATARIRIGPVPSPWMTIACLRLDGQDYLFNSLGTALKAKGVYRFFSWDIDTRSQGNRLRARIEAPANRFTALTYYNPPAGSKTCLNSKIARCELEFTAKGAEPVKLESNNSAAFEIFTDRDDHGVPVQV